MTELSGFEVLLLAKEIGSALEGTYVNNIYSLGDAQLLRFRRTGGGDVWLIASPSEGMWISENVSERAETTEFTSRLRSEIQRLKFASADQVDLDRVFELELGDGATARRLVLELMPPGNLLVLDPEGRIILAARETRAGRRRIVRGQAYVEPSQSRISPRSLRPEDVTKMMASETTLGKAVGKHVAIPRKYVVEVLARLSVKEEDAPSSLAGRESRVADVVAGLLDEAENNPRPCISMTPAGEEIFVVRPTAFVVVKEAPTVSELCDQALLPAVLESAASMHEPDPYDTKRLELEATIAKLKEQKETFVREAVRIRQRAAAAGSAASLDEATNMVLSEGLEAEPGSQAAAASALYDRAKYLEAKASAAEESARRLERKAPQRHAAPRKTKALPRRRQEWYEKFRWFYTTDGRLAIGGRDAQSNSMLVKRYLEDKDTAYHADLFGSPFFILKGGAEQTERDTREVAQATVAFSSAWKTGLGTADAYWVSPDQVATAAPSGEYLARGSFSIKGKKNFVPRNIVEVSVGLDDAVRLVSGPESAVRSHCGAYVTLRPFREKPSDTAKRVLKDLGAGGASQGGISIDDVLRALPAGGGRVVRKTQGARKPPQVDAGPPSAE